MALNQTDKQIGQVISLTKKLFQLVAKNTTYFKTGSSTVVRLNRLTLKNLSNLNKVRYSEKAFVFSQTYKKVAKTNGNKISQIIRKRGENFHSPPIT